MDDPVTAALKLCAKNVDWMPYPHCTQVDDALRAAWEYYTQARIATAALRAVLEDIAEERMPTHRPDGSRWWFDGGEGYHEWATQYARAALTKSEKQ